MRTKLGRSGDPFPERSCSLGFTEEEFSIKHKGLMYEFTKKDKIAVEHIHQILSKALAFQIQTNGVYPASPPSKSLTDMLIKVSSVI